VPFLRLSPLFVVMGLSFNNEKKNILKCYFHVR
jgi:hypothetical protein